MDLGLFEKSEGPSQQGVLDLGLFEKSKGPSQQGVLDLGLFDKSKGPSQQGTWTLDVVQLQNSPRKSYLNRRKLLKIRLARFARGCARLDSVYLMSPVTSSRHPCLEGLRPKRRARLTFRPQSLGGSRRGLGSWTFWYVQETLPRGGLGPWSR